MTTSDGVTLRHPPIPMVDVHPRLDIDTISILSSQSDSVPHLSSYIESDDEGKGLVGSHPSRIHEAIAQVSSSSTSHSQQPSALTKDWAMYLTKSTNSNNGKHRHHHTNESSSETSESDDDESSSSVDDDDDDDGSEQDLADDPWTINAKQREYYTKQFRSLQSDISKVISGHIAKEFFERSRLPTSELSQIWNLSDVNHDGALSLAEFCTAMHLVVLRVNGFELPDELPPQLQPYTPLIDLSDTATTILPQATVHSAAETTENWANFKDSPHANLEETNVHSPGQIPKQFTYVPPVADNHRIVAPVAVRLSPPPPPLPAPVKPPPPPPRAPGRTASIDIPNQPILPPRTLLIDTPQRNVSHTTTANQSSSTATTPFLYNRTRPSVASTPQQADPNALLGQIRDLLQLDHLQELTSILSTPSMMTVDNLQTALNQIKSRNTILKAQLKHWEDRLTDLIDKRISLELQSKLQQQQP